MDKLCCDEMHRMRGEEVFERYPANHSDVPYRMREQMKYQGKVMMMHTGAFGAVLVKFCPFCGVEFTQELLMRDAGPYD